MMWKERFVERPGRLVRAAAWLIGLVLGGFVAVGMVWFGRRAFEELWAHGPGEVTGAARDEFNMYLRFVGALMGSLGTLAVAALAAGGVASEREADTWTVLVSTTLEGPEILRAKMVGAAWALRIVGAALLACWGVGVLAGAIHPLGFAAAVVALAVYTWFAAALGTAFSLRSSSVLKAQAKAVGVMAFLNVGYLFCCIPTGPETAFVAAPCTPAILFGAPFSYRDLNIIGSGADTLEMMVAGVVSVVGYAVAAGVLTWTAFEGFDRAVDRPSAEGPALPPPAPKPKTPPADELA